jgi:tetratricopeptide (TPR) repeat protein
MMSPVAHAHDPRETLGERVKRLRLAAGRSQRDIAAPGLSLAYISRIERNQRLPSPKALRVLATKLSVPVEYLETGRDLNAHDARELAISDAALALRLGENPEGAARRLHELLLEARREDDLESVTSASIALGMVAAAEGRHQEAITLLGPLARAKAESPLARPDLFTTLGHSYAAVGAIDKSIALFRRCLRETQQQAPEDAPSYIRYATYLSYALTDAGRRDEAGKVLTAALARSGESDLYTRVRLYWSLARLASADGRGALALSHVRRAIELLRTTEDTLQLARAHLLCAQILNINGQHKEAHGHLAHADRLFEIGADARDLGRLHSEHAKAYARLCDPPRALAHAVEAIRLLAEMPAEQGGAYWARASVHAQLGEVDEAQTAFATAIERLGKLDEWRDMITIYNEWSEMLVQAGLRREAARLRSRARKLESQHGDASNESKLKDAALK